MSLEQGAIFESQSQDETVSFGRWLLALLIVQFTCGIGLLFYCFNSNKNLANWARAYVAFILAFILLYAVFTIGAVTMLGSQVSSTFEEVTTQMEAEGY